MKKQSVLERIATMIHGIASFFTRVSSNLSTFFQLKNSYELPAIEEKKVPKTESI